MIQIKQTKAVGSDETKDLAVLAKDFSVRLAKKASFSAAVTLAIAARGMHPVDIAERQVTFLQWLKSNYDEIVIGVPSKLADFIAHVGGENWSGLFHDGRRQTPFGDEVESILGYGESWFGPIRKWLAEALNIKSCPYCNAQYTLVVNDHKDKRVVKLQFDHFFPKNRHPWLCVSFYNLVPVCGNCNSAKSAEETTLQTHYHPYHSSMSDRARFVLEGPKDNLLSSLPELQRLKPGDLKVTLVGKTSGDLAFITKHDQVFDLSGIYRRHTDVAHELLTKAVLYNKHYRAATDKIEGLFPDRHVMMRYILGNYIEEERILDRPLAKFTQDIAKSLKLIDDK